MSDAMSDEDLAEIERRFQRAVSTLDGMCYEDVEVAVYDGLSLLEEVKRLRAGGKSP